MLKALAFVHFSSELMLKEQMIIPVKRNVYQRWSYRRKTDRFCEICPKKSNEIGCFLLIVSPRNFLWNRPIFLRICPWKSFENWLFCTKIPRNRPIFPWILTFRPRKSREIGQFSANLPLKIPRNFAFFSTKYQRPCFKGILASDFSCSLHQIYSFCNIALGLLVGNSDQR